MPELLSNPFYQFAAILVIAVIVGAIGTLLRQPLIVSFIAVGLIVGPSGLKIAMEGEQIALLSQMGIAILLFVVGLKLDVVLIRSIGVVATLTGVGQVIFTSVVGYFIAIALGFSPLHSIYVAVALTFSSTIIIIKLLSDKKEIDSLHGRIATGFLIVQDILVVFAMIGLTAYGVGTGENNVLREVSFVVLKGIGFLLSIALVAKYVFPIILNSMAKTPELLLLFAISWAIILATLGDYLGFSKEVGAFLGGVSLASTAYREAIVSRLVSIRDFLLLFFFVELGSFFDLDLLASNIPAAIVLSLFVLIGNPLIVMVIMGLMGYRRRTGFLAGLTVAQISEFSLILAALGVSLGHINQEILGLITLVGIITIGLSTYMILYSHFLYDRFSKYLRFFEKKITFAEEKDTTITPRAVDVLVFGLGRYGGPLLEKLSNSGLKVMGVDFNPDLIKHYAGKGFWTCYGDAEDPECFSYLPYKDVKWVVSTAPTLDAGRILLNTIKHYGYNGKVAVTAHSFDDKELLTRMGADLVLMPFEDAGEVAIEKIVNLLNVKEGIGV